MTLLFFSETDFIYNYLHIVQQKAVANCVVVKIEGVERILLENRFTKACLPFSVSDFPQLIITRNVA